MFNEIKSINKPFPYQTFSILICSAAVTFGTIFIFGNFTIVFGSFKSEISWLQSMSLIFQHGYDVSSGAIHFLSCAAIFALMGGSLEKMIGPNRFFVFNLSIIFIYGVSHKLLGMIGHGLTPLLFAYVPFIAYTLNEGRLIKTRSMYDEYYKTLWALVFIVLIVIPVLLSIIPIYFDSDATMMEQIYRGNILHVILLITGILFTWKWKEHARHRLLYFAKKKKFPAYRWEKYTLILPFAFPVILLIIFILAK